MRDPAAVLALLEEALEAMVLDDEDITARGAVRRLGGALKHPSDITRIEGRRRLLERFRIRQTEFRSMVERADKTSKANLADALAKRDERIAELERDRELLIASHRAAILAVGELGGIRSWLRFFESHSDALDRLESLKATPPAEVRPLRTAQGT